MRVFVFILTLLCLSASPTLAQNNGQGSGNGQGNANGQENGNSGGNNGNGPDRNSGNGNAGNSGNNGNGQGGNTTTAGPETSVNTDANGTVHYSQDYARDVVNAGRAVSLASLIPELQARSEGSVIDAELLNVQGILVYSVKVLRTDGRVTQEYYYAQSGRFIGERTMKVLVAEDDERIADVLQSALGRSGFEVHCEKDGEVAWYRADTEDFDAIILDLGLPQMDGLTVLKRWRRGGLETPVLILTARGQWEERVEGIEAGADDYVVKPFHALEIVARIRALIRRSKGVATPRIPFGKYELDMRSMQVTEDGLPMDLTPQEFRLMAYLLHNRGRTVSQLEITEHIYRQDFERESNAVEVLVARLRKRLGHEVVKTRRGFGYTLGDEY